MTLTEAEWKAGALVADKGIQRVDGRPFREVLVTGNDGYECLYQADQNHDADFNAIIDHAWKKRRERYLGSDFENRAAVGVA